MPSKSIQIDFKNNKESKTFKSAIEMLEYLEKRFDK